MGLKGWIDNLQGVTRAVRSGGTSATAAAQPGEIEPDGPQFSPIEGVDLPTFTRVSHGLTSRGVTEEAPVLAYVEAQGIDPTKWQTIAEGWNERIIGDDAVKVRFGQLYFALDGAA